MYLDELDLPSGGLQGAESSLGATANLITF